MKDEVLYERLFLKAKAILENSYSPYSNYKVGAALITREGKIFTGVNVENASYGATICAEASALGNMISVGENAPFAIAVCAKNKEGSYVEAPPCGICRQRLLEFNSHIIIIYGADEENLKVSTLEKLLPQGFSLQGE